MLALTVGIIALTSWRPRTAWSLILVGLTSIAFADIAYSLQSTSAGIPEGVWTEPFYLLAACPRRRRLAPPGGQITAPRRSTAGAS